MPALWRKKVQVIPDDPNTVPMCELDHECVVCGKLTLAAKQHAVRGVHVPSRGSSSRYQKKCMEYFNVRCDECRKFQRMPDRTLYKAWFELSVDEIEANYQPTDGRKVFFEVM
jgi:hypothetical protein